MSLPQDPVLQLYLGMEPLKLEARWFLIPSIFWRGRFVINGTGDPTRGIGILRRCLRHIDVSHFRPTRLPDA